MPESSAAKNNTACSLLCLRAPGSVETEVAALQERLYTLLGRVSGLCLPPQIPLLFLPAPAELPPEETLSDLLAAGLRLGTRGYREAGGCLFWSLAEIGSFTAWKRSLLARLPRGGGKPASPERGLFPPKAGFFLARRDEAADLPPWPGDREALTALLGPPRALSFPAAALCLLEIRLLAEPARWWRGVIWEEKARLPLRKPSPGS